MIDVANARINSLPKTIDVSPNEEAVFILTASQLQDVITKAIQPLQDRIESQDVRIAAQDEKIAALESTVNTQAENQFIQLRLIHDLREAFKKDSQPLQKARGEILRALLVANGGKMLAKDARQKMRLDKATFSRLLDTLKDDIAIKPLHMDKRKLVLILKIS